MLQKRSKRFKEQLWVCYFRPFFVVRLNQENNKRIKPIFFKSLDHQIKKYAKDVDCNVGKFELIKQPSLKQ